MDDFKFKDNIINIGDQFGYIEITSNPFHEKDDSGQKYVYYYCKCRKCGKENIKMRRGNLLSNNIKSCGCISEKRRKNNKYDMSHYYGICYFNNPDHGYFIFDKEDYDLIKDLCWCKSVSGYVVSRDRDTGAIIYLHKMIMKKYYPNELTGDLVVDHIDCDKMNNMKNNLRICSPLENSYNHKLSINNTSGITGVKQVQLKDQIKYVAEICVDHKTIDLGHYDNEQDAKNARILAEQKYFGNFAFKEIKKPINPFKWIVKNGGKMKRDE